MIWQEKRLGDLADIQLGKMLDQKKNRGEYRPYLGNDNVQWNELKLDEIKLMRIQDSERERFRLRPGDLLVCEGGDPGRCALWSTNEEIYYQKALHRVRVGSELDPEYLLYYMMHLGTTQAIRQYYTGSSTIKHLPNAAIKRVVIRYPSLSDQKMIASYLRSYDVLIENNRKQIKLLEEAAQRLYKEWFIDLRFPGHEDAETDPETGLPEGWRSELLIENATVQYGYSFDATFFNSAGAGTPIIRIRNVQDGFSNDFTTEEFPSKYQVSNGDLLVGMDGEFYINTWVGGDAALVQRSCRIKPGNSINEGYLKCALKPQLVALQNGIVGATVAHLGKKHIDAMRITIPDESLMEIFAQIERRSLLLRQACRKASEARDRLLPRLMEGEVVL